MYIFNTERTPDLSSIWPSKQVAWRQKKIFTMLTCNRLTPMQKDVNVCIQKTQQSTLTASQLVASPRQFLEISFKYKELLSSTWLFENTKKSWLLESHAKTYRILKDFLLLSRHMQTCCLNTERRANVLQCGHAKYSLKCWRDLSYELDKRKKNSVMSRTERDNANTALQYGEKNSLGYRKNSNFQSSMWPWEQLIQIQKELLALSWLA